MMTAPNINEILGLIQFKSPVVLEELKLKYHAYKDILSPGKTLGAQTGSTDLNEVLVRANICFSGLQIALKVCDDNLPVLKKRLKTLGNIQFITQILIGISGATLLSHEEAAYPAIKIITGALALIGSLLTLYTQHRSGAILNNAQSIFTLYDKLVDNKFEAEALKQEIDIEIKIFDKNKPSDKLVDMINAANKICLEIRKTLDKI